MANSSRKHGLPPVKNESAFHCVLIHIRPINDTQSHRPSGDVRIRIVLPPPPPPREAGESILCVCGVAQTKRRPAASMSKAEARQNFYRTHTHTQSIAHTAWFSGYFGHQKRTVLFGCGRRNGGGVGGVP